MYICYINSIWSYQTQKNVDKKNIKNICVAKYKSDPDEKSDQ